MPRHISRTQFLERAARLSVLGRFQIYGYFFQPRRRRYGNVLARVFARVISFCYALLWPD